MKNKRIILVGAGNVASHIAPALLKSGANLCQIYSRTMESARMLGKKTGITYTTEVSAIYPDGDIYIFCLKDDVLPEILKQIQVDRNALLLHTSGSLPMDIFKGSADRYGVVYPIQSFTKRRDLDFRDIPLCLEASSPRVMKEVRLFASMLSDKLEEISTEKRKVLHLAAVFANNFANRMYGYAGSILEREGLSFDLLRPIIFETADKVMQMTPDQAQTGPARRGDETIMNMHRSLLQDDPKLLNLYNLMSEEIRSLYLPAAGENEEDSPEQPKMLTLW